MNGNLIKVERDARKWRVKVEDANKLVFLMLKDFIQYIFFFLLINVGQLVV